MIRAPAVAVLVVVLGLAGAVPAFAHGPGSAEASNYLSTVRRVTGADGRPVDGLDVRVSSDGSLSLTNRTGLPVVVVGPEGEPYLRIAPASVEVSVATGWERVGDGPSWSWHDDRAHWQAATAPPAVKVDPARRVDVLAWTVPLELDGEAVSVEGAVTWVPAPAWQPWLLAGVAVLAVPLLAGLRSRAPLGGAAAGLGLAAAFVLARGVDLALLPGATGPALPAGAAMALGAARRVRSAALVVAAGGALLLAVSAPDALQVLTASQVPARLPAALVRLSAALGLAVVLPTALAVLTRLRRSAPPATARSPEATPVPWH